LALGNLFKHTIQRLLVHQPEGNLQAGDPLHAQAVHSIVGGVEGTGGGEGGCGAAEVVGSL